MFQKMGLKAMEPRTTVLVMFKGGLWPWRGVLDRWLGD